MSEYYQKHAEVLPSNSSNSMEANDRQEELSQVLTRLNQNLPNKIKVPIDNGELEEIHIPHNENSIPVVIAALKQLETKSETPGQALFDELGETKFLEICDDLEELFSIIQLGNLGNLEGSSLNLLNFPLSKLERDYSDNMTASVISKLSHFFLPYRNNLREREAAEEKQKDKDVETVIKNFDTITEQITSSLNDLNATFEAQKSELNEDLRVIEVAIKKLPESIKEINSHEWESMMKFDNYNTLKHQVIQYLESNVSFFRTQKKWAKEAQTKFETLIKQACQKKGEIQSIEKNRKNELILAIEGLRRELEEAQRLDAINGNLNRPSALFQNRYGADAYKESIPGLEESNAQISQLVKKINSEFPQIYIPTDIRESLVTYYNFLSEVLGSITVEIRK